MSIDVTETTRVDATSVECPTCHAWVGWSCKGPNYGYHAAGYHPSRERAAERAVASAQIDLRAITRGKQ
ncbi:MAG TPA: hypothetical protein VLE97_08655 [Gaiellaceae bacterium]|nr:hypothetical protein [Gaiellaceae bacterium]